MELRQLRYFVAVADELHFTRAARKLHVAQPALSRQIRQLEDELGALLLERTPRSVSLTPNGQSFLPEARSLLAQAARAVRAAQDAGQNGHAALNIGYAWGLFHSLVQAAVERFRQISQNVAVNLLDMTVPQQATALREGRLDVGFIGFANDAEAPGLARQRIGSCSLVVALPAKHPAARRRTIELRQLERESFCAISAENFPGAAQCAIDACASAGFRPNILETAARGAIQLGLVASNCGVALMPEPLTALPHPGVVFRPLSRARRYDLFVAWHTRHSTNSRDAFLHSLE